MVTRAPDCVQIGTDAPRRAVLQDAPAGTVRLLADLDGGRPVADVLTQHDADPLVWHGLLEQLLLVELLVPAADRSPSGQPGADSRLTDEWTGLVHRYGQVAAGRILQTRDDALVVVRGDGPVTRALALWLAAAGIGHLHQDRPAATWFGRGTGRAPRDERSEAHDAQLRATYPGLRLHEPAAHQHPTLVVMADIAVADLPVAAAYNRQRTPHLPVITGPARAAVGPLVLPGRTTCLACVHRHRTEADPGWPTVARQLGQFPHRTPASVVVLATSLTVPEVLDHVDGLVRPETVDGTVEWQVTDRSARRRSWQRHPDCGCAPDL